MLLVLLAIAGGMAITAALFRRAFPEASIEFRVNRAQARQIAEKFLAERGRNVAGHRFAARFYVDEEPKVYLERELGPGRGGAFLRDHREGLAVGHAVVPVRGQGRGARFGDPTRGPRLLPVGSARGSGRSAADPRSGAGDRVAIPAIPAGSRRPRGARSRRPRSPGPRAPTGRSWTRRPGCGSRTRRSGTRRRSRATG